MKLIISGHSQKCRTTGRFFKNLVFLFLLASIHLCLNGQNQSIVVTQYTVEDGLRQSMVKNMVQDKRGILWMTTGDGLQCFDGSQFYLWRVPSREPFVASDNMFRYMTEADSTHLLLASPASVTLFDKLTGKFSLIQRCDGLFPVIFKTTINGLPMVWLADKNFYVVRENRLEKIKVEYQDTNHQENIYHGLKSVYLNDSVILIQTQRAILELHIQKSELGTINGKMSTFLMPGMVQAIETTNRGEVILAIDNMIVNYTGKGSFRKRKELPFDNTVAMYAGEGGSVLISDNDNKALYQLKGNDLQEVKILVTDAKTGISAEVKPFIVNFYVDRDKMLWICTDGHGIFSYNPNSVVCHKNDLGFTRCIEEHNEKIMVGTFKNGLWETNHDLSVKRAVNQALFPMNSDIYDIYSYKNEQLWVLTDSELIVLDNNYNPLFREPNNQGSGLIRGCDNGELLVSQNGIVRFYETKGFSFKRTFTPFKPITSSVKVNEEFIYGTSSEMLKFDPGLFNRDTIYIHNLQIIEEYPVKSMLQRDNAIWTATNDGVWIWNFTEDKAKPEKRGHFLDNESIYSLLDDNYNRIWFSSNTGIGFINTNDSTTHFLGMQHNLQSLEFNSYAALKSSRGLLYFGGIKGVNAINPIQIGHKRPESAPVLSRLKIADTLYTQGIPNVQHIELSYNQANFSGRFGSVNYGEGKSQLYSTQLVGHDSDWGIASRTPDFSYQNLRRGKYEFWVKYADDLQQWSSPFLLLTVTVHPPVWLRWWFIVLVATGLFLAIYFLNRKIQERKYRRIIEQLEREAALERERVRISRDLHDELGAGLSLIMLNASQSKNVLDDREKVERNFENIAKNTRELYDSMSNLVWLLKPENQSFESLKVRLREMVGGILEDSGMDYHISLPENKDGLKIQREAGQHILLIVRESVNNALKHSGATHFSFEMALSNGQVHISLTDNGKGFITELARPAGNGLKNLDYRTKSLGGNMTIFSAPDKGTSITCKLPAEKVFES